MTTLQTEKIPKNSTFESLFGELSSELINVPSESIDVAIQSSLKKLVEFFEVDRCHLGKISTDESNNSIPFFYPRPNLNIPQLTEVGEHYLSFVYERIKQDKWIVFSKSSKLSSKAKKDGEVIILANMQHLIALDK